jgi:hypothetical protein
MMSKKGNQLLYQAAEAAIEKLFSDTSVSPEECLANLRGLKDDLEMKIDCVESDLRRLSGDE